MYSFQKGLLPRASWLLGAALVCFAFVIFLLWMMAIIKQLTQSSTALVDTIIYAVVWLLPLFVGRFLMGLFPAIRLTDEGIHLKSGAWPIGTVRWEEIAEVVQLSPDLTVLAIRRKGLPLLNGLYFNRFYGMIVRSRDPVVLLSSSLKDRSEIVTRAIQELRHSRPVL